MPDTFAVFNSASKSESDSDPEDDGLEAIEDRREAKAEPGEPEVVCAEAREVEESFSTDGWDWHGECAEDGEEAGKLPEREAAGATAAAAVAVGPRRRSGVRTLASGQQKDEGGSLSVLVGVTLVPALRCFEDDEDSRRSRDLEDAALE
jgi:hypothetical protein